MPGGEPISEPGFGGAVVRGAVWTWLSVVAVAVVQLAYTATTSRFVDQEAIGLVAVALVGLRLITLIARFGLGSAVAQRDALSEDELGRVVRLALVLGAFGTSIGIAMSPLISAWLNAPAASSVMSWLSLGIGPSVVNGVLDGALRRRLRFRSLALLQVGSLMVAYLGVGVGLALSGFGWASLVAATVSLTFVQLIVQWRMVRPRWRRLPPSPTHRSLARFGGLVSLTSITEALTSSADSFLVGRWLGPAAVGQYSRATYLVALPVEQLSTATSRVLTPALSRLQADGGRFAEALTRAAGLQAVLIMTPVSLACIASPTLVSLVLGDGWDLAAEVMPVVGLASGLLLLTQIIASAAEARGALTSKLLVQLLTVLSLGLALGLVALVGPSAYRAAWAWAVGEMVRHVLYWLIVLPKIGVDRRALARQFVSASEIAAISSLPLLVVYRLIGWQHAGAVASAAAAGVLLAGTLAWVGAFATLGGDIHSLFRVLVLRKRPPA